MVFRQALSFSLCLSFSGTPRGISEPKMDQSDIRQRVFFEDKHISPRSTREPTGNKSSMDERRIVAAILAAGLAPSIREKGHSFGKAAEQAVQLYRAVLLALESEPPSSPQPS
jgi:hypothetical protein